MARSGQIYREIERDTAFLDQIVACLATLLMLTLVKRIHTEEGRRQWFRHWLLLALGLFLQALLCCQGAGTRRNIRFIAIQFWEMRGSTSPLLMPLKEVTITGQIVELHPNCFRSNPLLRFAIGAKKGRIAPKFQQGPRPNRC